MSDDGCVTPRRGGRRFVPEPLSSPSAAVKSEPRLPAKKNKLSHAHAVKLQPSSNTVLFLEVFTRVLEPILLDLLPLTSNLLPENVERNSWTASKDIPLLIQFLIMGFQTRWNLCQRCSCFYIWGPLLPHTFSWLPSNHQRPTEHAHWET